jgi:hypothetical protein
MTKLLTAMIVLSFVTPEAAAKRDIIFKQTGPRPCPQTLD